MPSKKKKAAVKKILIPKVEPKLIDHVVTAEDLVESPELITQGVEVGQTIQVAEDAIIKDTKEDKEEEDEDEDEDTTDEVEVSVYKDNGEFVRTYSLETHGEGFKDLAKEYADKIAGFLK